MTLRQGDEPDTASLFRLDGKTALITGGAGGLGWIMAQALADVGADVLVTSRSTELPQTGEQRAGRIRHIGFYDLAEREGLIGLVDAVSNAAPSLDILINSAGVYSTQGLMDCDEETWDNILDGNLKSVFFLTKGLLPLLKKGASGGQRSRIINIGSVVGRFPAGIVPYAISKSGIHHLTQILAGQVVRSGINVNAIAPGAFRTPMTDAQLDAMGPEFEKSIPVGRIGCPSDIAAAAVFLSSQASDFITGHILPLDGGYADLMGVDPA